MIIKRTRHFSYSSEKMIDKVIEQLDRERIEDYEVEERIPKDVISISVDDRGIVSIYLPRDFEYSQFDIDDQVRRIKPHYRTSISQDRNLYIMKISGPMTIKEICVLIEYIITTNDFCSIIK